MTHLPDDAPGRHVPWLPDEHFELALDARTGMASSPVAGEHVLTITTRRAVQLGRDTGKRTTTMVPLECVTDVEVVDSTRPTERLTQGLLVFGVGVLLGVITWIALGQELITLLVGGLPVLVAIYILAGYFFPDIQPELVLHTGTYALHQPLLTPQARHDAYLAAHRIFELMEHARHADDEWRERRAPAAPGRTPEPGSEATAPSGPASQPQWSSTWASPAQTEPSTPASVARPYPPAAPSQQWWERPADAGPAAQDVGRAQVAPPTPRPTPPPQPEPAPPEPPREPPPAPPQDPQGRTAEWSPRREEESMRPGYPANGPERPIEYGRRHDMAEEEEHRDEMAPAAERALEETSGEEDAAPRRE